MATLSCDRGRETSVENVPWFSDSELIHYKRAVVFRFRFNKHAVVFTFKVNKRAVVFRFRVNKPAVDFRFRVNVFGANPSPYSHVYLLFSSV